MTLDSSGKTKGSSELFIDSTDLASQRAEGLVSECPGEFSKEVIIHDFAGKPPSNLVTPLLATSQGLFFGLDQIEYFIDRQRDRTLRNGH